MTAEERQEAGLAARTALEETQELVPAVTRARIKQALLEAFQRGLRGQSLVQEVTMLIIAEALAGNANPEMLKAIQPFVEVLLTSVTAQGLAEKSDEKDTGPSALARRLADSRKKMGAVRPNYMLTDGGGETTITMGVAGERVAVVQSPSIDEGEPS